MGVVDDSREEGWGKCRDSEERRGRCSQGFAGSEKSHPLVQNLLGFAGGFVVRVAVDVAVESVEDIEL